MTWSGQRWGPQSLLQSGRDSQTGPRLAGDNTTTTITTTTVASVLIVRDSAYDLL
jgi:hypothetical protein